jgi:large subunit ribosomal protein L7/L12
MSERTWSPAVKEMGDKIAGLTISTAVELRDYLKEVHKIEPAGGAVVAMAPGGGGGGGGGAAEAPAAKTEFTVTLEGADAANKIKVIKVVRELTSLGLAEAKAFVEGAPKPVKENVSKEEAETVKKKLEEAGGKVSIK